MTGLSFHADMAATLVARWMEPSLDADPVESFFEISEQQASCQIYVQRRAAHAPSASTFMGWLCGCFSVRSHLEVMQYGPIISY